MDSNSAQTSFGDTPTVLMVLPWGGPHTYDRNLVRGESTMKQSLREAIGDEIRENLRHDGLPTLTPGEMADRILAVVQKHSPSVVCEHPRKLICTKDAQEDCTCTCVVCHGA